MDQYWKWNEFFNDIHWYIEKDSINIRHINKPTEGAEVVCMIICKKDFNNQLKIFYSWILLIGSSEINSVNDMHNTSKTKLFHQNKISGHYTCVTILLMVI